MVKALTHRFICIYLLLSISVIGMGKSWYGPFSFFTNKIEKFQWAILSKLNIAISVVNGPFFCSMCQWPMTPHYPNH